MTNFVFSNFYSTTLASNLSSSGTTITVASSIGLPALAAGQVLPMILNDAATRAVHEVVYVTSISGSVLTVLRGQEGTSAAAWLTGDYIYADVTQATVAPVNGSVAQVFNVANSTAATNQAIPRSQADSLYALIAGSSGQTFSVANAASSTQAVALGQFAASMTTGGYQKLPSGLIVQWGNNAVGAPSTVTFPIAFPNACFSVVVSESNASAGTWGAARPTIHGAESFTTTNYTAWAEAWTGSTWAGGSISQAFIAIGY